ncbi:helix-turn-helix transcriptional regulator [Niabella insulamsoli]|uniref:helix-turn-helix domain-containing protein n=1 Tax=Niabella insulamsoli TaxID=3144874 RepID=UPI0031FC4818
MIHHKLKALRKEKGISQLQMSLILNKSQSAYWLMEAGQSKIDAALIPDLCRALGVTPDQLFDFKSAASSFHEKEEYIKIIRLLKDELDKKNEIIKLSLTALAEFDKAVEKNKDLIHFLNIVRGNMKSDGSYLAAAAE